MKDAGAKERGYLQDILSAISRIDRYVEGGTRAFFRDEKTQDAVVRQIAIIGEAAARLPASLTAAYRGVPWRNIIGMRNVVIHNYIDTDLPTVWETVNRDLPRLRSHVEKILAALELEENGWSRRSHKENHCEETGV